MVYESICGRSTGYAIISVEQMWYKLHYPAVFWYVKIKYAGNDGDIAKYSEYAVKDSAVVLLPHVNGTAKTSLAKVDGEQAIQQGLVTMKDVGLTAAEQIEKERKEHGVYKSYDDFYDRNVFKGSPVNKRTIEALEVNGALEFNKKRYYRRVVKYNSALYAR